MLQQNVTGNSKIRHKHRFIILNFIREHGSVSRTEIHEKTRISKPTITRVIEELLKEKLVRESGTGESEGGRKPVYVELNPSALYCIGINISRNRIRASIVDMAMNVIDRKVVSIKHIMDADTFQDTIAATIRELYQECNVDFDKILGIGIGVPGLVDFDSGAIVDFASGHNLTNIHLKEFLEDKFNLEVFVDNNAKTRALGEYWYGYGAGYKNLLFVICSEGIGSGIIINGNIARGKSNVTGEIGHMIVNIDGRKCNCGRYGCLEAYCSTEAIENITKEALKRGRSSSIMESVNGNIELVDYKLICECAELGDQLCLEILEEAACILSTGLVNTIGIINPELVILSGDLFDESEYFYNSVTKHTKEKLLNSSAQDVIFMKRKVKDSLYEIGAATMVYKAFFTE